MIENTGDTPSYYRVVADPMKTFRAYPVHGLIKGKSFQVVSVEFNPKKAKGYDFNLQFVFNHSLANLHQVALKAWSCEPSLLLKEGGQIYFPPCLPGVSHKEKFYFKNNSRIPIEYSVEIPEKYKSEVSTEPFVGTL